MGLAPGSSLARNGVRTRYFAGEDDTASALSAAAIEHALAAAGLAPDDLDAILFASVLPEQPLPATAILVHQRLRFGRTDVACYDINASCAGFLKGLEIAAASIHAGIWRNAAVVAAELASKGLNWSDLDTCTLFGDGAAAAIVGSCGPGDGSGVISIRSVTVSEGVDLCTIRAGGSRFNIRNPPADDRDYLFAMNGRGLLRLVQSHLPAFLDALVHDAGEPLKLIVPHQASAIGLAYLRKLRRDTKVVDILSEVGNQVTASIPSPSIAPCEGASCSAATRPCSSGRRRGYR